MTFLVEPKFSSRTQEQVFGGDGRRQKTPRGHPDFNSYVKILRVLVCITDRQTFISNSYVVCLCILHRNLIQWCMQNKYTRYAWAGGTFFPVVLLCQFFVLARNRFWFYILMYLEYNTVVALCQFFVLAGNSFWCYVRTQCTIQLCSCVSVLAVAGNSSQNENTF